LSHADQSGESLKNQAPSFDDIPVAEREVVEAPPKPKSRRWLWILGGSAIVLAAGGWFAYQWTLSRGIANPVPSPSNNAIASAPPTPSPDGRVLNHFAYKEAPQSELEAISGDGGMKLRAPAARAFRDMVAAASAEGISLMPLSAFRSEKEQEEVYFNVKAERGQSLEQRAQVSAPPGHSEHHTGYAIDIGDGNVPAANLSPTFEQTRAFQWLQANANRFNFEMSFPKDNKQGVTYEPWHWRFVGDKQSFDTFYKAKQFEEGQSASPSPDASPAVQDSQPSPSPSN
jgi:D-alanyl-D-alanine carboxypeptidase